MKKQRTPAKEKAKEIAKLLQKEHPDYNYLKSIFRHLRKQSKSGKVRQRELLEATGLSKQELKNNW